MKKIEAIIRSSKFREVREALKEIGVNFFTFREVKGYGHQKGEQMVYRGTAYDMGYIARMQLEILSPDEQVSQIVETITVAGRTGEIGDGKIIVIPVEHVTRVRTGETNHDAIN